MVINSLSQQAFPASPAATIKSTTIEDHRSALQNQSTVTDYDGDSDNSGGDTVKFSTDSLQLAKTSTVPNASAQLPITDQQQAQQLVGQLVSNPEQMSAAFGQISSTHAKSLMV